ncbi:hypothetical protein HYT18_00690 [Candidatus Microgenomates bacterium]|nr:hypothetical protein [Candidatus Microgenomates bacterium]
MESDRSGQGIQVNLPNNVTILYSDSTFLTINQYGVVLDFAQRVGTTNQQTVVSRLGMSKEHAKVLIAALKELLEKDELNQKQVTFSPSKKKIVS